MSNPYQAKLEAIKAKRLNKRERLHSLFIFLNMAFMGLLIIPFFGYGWILGIYNDLDAQYNTGWLHIMPPVVGLFLAACATFVIFYNIGIGLKHLTRFLSGIRE